MSLGPDSSGQYRVMCPAKTPKLHAELDKRGIRPVLVEVGHSEKNGGAIRCATLVLRRDDN